MDGIKQNDICIYRSPRRRREKGVEKLFEKIAAENLTNLGKKTDTQFQKAQKVPKKINPKRSTPSHIMIKMSKK